MNWRWRSSIASVSCATSSSPRSIPPACGRARPTSSSASGCGHLQRRVAGARDLAGRAVSSAIGRMARRATNRPASSASAPPPSTPRASRSHTRETVRSTEDSGRAYAMIALLAREQLRRPRLDPEAADVLGLPRGHAEVGRLRRLAEHLAVGAMTRMAAFSASAYVPRSGPTQPGRPVRGSSLYWIRSARSLAARRVCSSKSDRMRAIVSDPMITAKPQRMTSVRTAEPPASRQRTGSRLYAENVACAADRMKESGLATGFELPAEVRDEDFDRVGLRKRVVAPDLVEKTLTGDHQALVAHQVLEQLELALG